VESIKPESVTREEQKLLVDYIVSWTKHPGVYKTFLKQPISKVRKGLSVLFDETRDVQSRLEDIECKKYLSMSTL
jgi:hypothetical protein